MPSLAAFAQLLLMRGPVITGVVLWPLHLDSCPLLQAVGDALDIGLLIERQTPKPFAGSATLAEHLCVVSVVFVLRDVDGDDLASPAGLRAVKHARS